MNMHEFLILLLVSIVALASIGLFSTMYPSQKRADTLRLSERRRRYRNLAEAMPIIVWTARPDGVISHINKRWRHYTGRSFEQSAGWMWMAAVHPDDFQRCLNRLIKSIREGTGCTIQCRLRRKDGCYRRHRIQMVPERDLKGELTGWFGTAVDIDIHEVPQEREEEEKMKAV